MITLSPKNSLYENEGGRHSLILKEAVVKIPLLDAAWDDLPQQLRFRRQYSVSYNENLQTH